MEDKWIAVMVVGCAFAASLAAIFSPGTIRSEQDKRVAAYRSCMNQFGSTEQTCKELAFGKESQQK